jgi:hypothetical protein
MDISYKEAAEIIENIVSLWDKLSNNPEDLSNMSDHCHDVHDEVLYVASKLKEKEGNI